MAAPAKFLFNADFTPGAKSAERPLTSVELAARLAEAEAAGYRKGLAAAAEAEAKAEAEARQRAAAALERIAAAVETLTKSLQAIQAKLEAETVEVALAVARKLANALIAREPLGEVAALAADCFKQLAAPTHVVVRVHDSLHELARQQIDEIARLRGFEGRLVVLAEPDIAVGDCRIEWADGGLIRDRAATEAAIAEMVARYIAARRPATDKISRGQHER